MQNLLLTAKGELKLGTLLSKVLLLILTYVMQPTSAWREPTAPDL